MNYLELRIFSDKGFTAEVKTLVGGTESLLDERYGLLPSSLYAAILATVDKSRQVGGKRFSGVAR